MKQIFEILNFTFGIGDFEISVKGILIMIFALVLAAYILKISRKLITKKLPQEDKLKFISIFGYLKWLIYSTIFLIVLSSSGVDLTSVFEASVALGDGDDPIKFSVIGIILFLLALIISSYVLKISRKLITKTLPREDKIKFIPIFGYLKWLIYSAIFLVTLNSSGVDLTAVLAASAALLIGVGLALQTLFQDIISGIFILIDQTVHVGDIIELDGKVGRIDEINLRTTSAVTIDNKVLIIPNHLYLTNSLYNWTQNGVDTREYVDIGVAYGSDTQLVKSILEQVASQHPKVLKKPEPVVRFTDFGDSALMFRLIFTLNNSFEAGEPKSDIRFEIDKQFRDAGISIPFPQRDIHIINNPKN